MQLLGRLAVSLWVIVLVLAACGDDEELSPKARSASTAAGVTPAIPTAEPPDTPAADPGVATPLATLTAAGVTPGVPNVEPPATPAADPGVATPMATLTRA